MKTKTNRIARILVVLTLYVCCSSVVCCEADKATVLKETSAQESSPCNKQSYEEDLNPVQPVSIHIMQLL